MVSVTVQRADTGDTTSMNRTVIAVAEQLGAVQPGGPCIEEVVGDKGYHSKETLTDLKALGLSATSSSDQLGGAGSPQPARSDSVGGGTSRANRRHVGYGVKTSCRWCGTHGAELEQHAVDRRVRGRRLRSARGRFCRYSLGSKWVWGGGHAQRRKGDDYVAYGWVRAVGDVG